MNSLGVCYTHVCPRAGTDCQRLGSLAHQRVGAGCPIIFVIKRRMEGGARVFLVRRGHLLKTFYTFYTFWFHSKVVGPVPVSTTGPPSRRFCAGGSSGDVVMIYQRFMDQCPDYKQSALVFKRTCNAAISPFIPEGLTGSRSQYLTETSVTNLPNDNTRIGGIYLT